MRPRRSLIDTSLQRPSALSSLPRSSNFLWLDKNENIDPVLLAVNESVLASIPATALSTYPEAGDLYRKLGNWIETDPEAILLTPGSDGAIRLVIEAFIEDGDSLLLTSPTFAMYPVYGQMFGAKVNTIEYEASVNGAYIDAKTIYDALHSCRPKVFCLPNPDSPTGAILKPEILSAILSTCESIGTLLLIDEAYHPFYEWSAIPWTKKSKNLVVVRTFAKAWGLAGLRIGYAVAHPETILLLHKMRPMYEVSTLAIEFMLRMIDRKEEMYESVLRIMNGKKLFAERMKAMGFGVLPGEGNFINVAFGDRRDIIDNALVGHVLYRKSFDHPSLAGFTRFSVAPVSIMEKVASLIEQCSGEINEK